MIWSGLWRKDSHWDCGDRRESYGKIVCGEKGRWKGSTPIESETSFLQNGKGMTTADIKSHM